MSKVDEVWNIFYGLMRNYPLWPSTMSKCECGRSYGRGAGPCAVCLEEELTKQVGPDLARKARVALVAVQEVWYEIADKVRATS